MVVVAIVALSMWARFQVEARRSRFRQLIQRYYEKRMAASAFAYSGPGGAVMERLMKADEVRRAEASAYYTALIHTYERAARYPWLPVAPDPPSPHREGFFGIGARGCCGDAVVSYWNSSHASGFQEGFGNA
jgi:hypothetical protein